MWYTNGNVMIDDICLACKECNQIGEQRRIAERVMAQEQMQKEIASGTARQQKIA